MHPWEDVRRIAKAPHPWGSVPEVSQRENSARTEPPPTFLLPPAHLQDSEQQRWLGGERPGGWRMQGSGTGRCVSVYKESSLQPPSLQLLHIRPSLSLEWCRWESRLWSALGESKVGSPMGETPAPGGCPVLPATPSPPSTRRSGAWLELALWPSGILRVGSQSCPSQTQGKRIWSKTPHFAPPSQPGIRRGQNFHPDAPMTFYMKMLHLPGQHKVSSLFWNFVLLSRGFEGTFLGFQISKQYLV